MQTMQTTRASTSGCLNNKTWLDVDTERVDTIVACVSTYLVHVLTQLLHVC
jgi:hypothetical protein